MLAQERHLNAIQKPLGYGYRLGNHDCVKNVRLKIRKPEKWAGRALCSINIGCGQRPLSAKGPPKGNQGDG